MTVETGFSTVGRVLYAQVLMALLVTSGYGLIEGWQAMLSPLMGGLVAIIPNLYFAYKIYLARAQEPQGIVRAFYTGETIKLLLTGALFALVIQIPGISFLALLASFAAVLSVFWFALLLGRG